jgi:hypothetical protein
MNVEKDNDYINLKEKTIEFQNEINKTSKHVYLNE